MNDLNKRSLLKLAALTAVASAALIGCGKKEEAAAPAAAPAPAPAPAAAAPAPAAPLNIAFAYIGPVGDGGWTFAHDNGRKALEKEFGDKIKTTFVESVPEGADAERVFRDMVGQGNKLIFGTTFGYMEPMLKVATDSKDVKFEHATGYKTAENMRTYDSRTYEGAYMAGVIAGAMTKSNTLGVVGSVPIPEVLRNINSFTLGAQSVNPKITTKVVWVNEWFSPPKETEAATALINGGADVLFQNTDSPAVLKTAQEKGKRAFGWDSDMTAYGPKAHLGSATINWAPYYIKATQDALDGKWSDRPELVGREGRRHRPRVDRRRRAGRSQGQGRGSQEGPEGRQLRDLEGPDPRPGRQGSGRQGRGGRRQVPDGHQLLRQGRGRQGAGRRQEVINRAKAQAG
jgi:basic membrane protein A